MNDVVNRAQVLYEVSCPDLTDRTCPGSLELLRTLQREGIPAGLVTGKLTAIGWKKMDSAGLRPYLGFGAFAEMGDTRADLVRIALTIARDRGWIAPRTRVSLVGDHPNDVEAARQNGIQSIAVCTGVVGRKELEACQPNLLFENLTGVTIEHLLY
jgi:phosphoglycolate phosphatase-like HAD superfamily hydrolase